MPLRGGPFEQGKVNLHGLEGHKHGIFGCALDQAVLFQLGNIGVDVGIVAFNGFCQGIDGAWAALAQGLQQVDARRRQFREQRAGRVEAQVVVRAETRAGLGRLQLLARRLEDRAARGDFDAPSLTPIDRSQLQSVTNPGYSPA